MYGDLQHIGGSHGNQTRCVYPGSDIDYLAYYSNFPFLHDHDQYAVHLTVLFRGSLLTAAGIDMEHKHRELIAIGAATTANCIPCLEFHFKKARDLDATIVEIEEAIEVGRMVRRGSARSWDKEAAKLIGNDETGEIHDG